MIWHIETTCWWEYHLIDFPSNIWSHCHWTSLTQKHLFKSSQPGPPTGASFRGFRGFCKAGATLAVKERQSSASWLSHLGGWVYAQVRFITKVHPWKLTAGTWKWCFSKRNLLFQGSIVRFHISFRRRNSWATNRKLAFWRLVAWFFMVLIHPTSCWWDE